MSGPSFRHLRSPLEILVIGDFSGREATSGAHGPPPEKRDPLPVDTIDDVMGRLEPRIRLGPDDGGPADLRFRELEDFHPDRLVRRLKDPGQPAVEARRESGGSDGAVQSQVEGLLDAIVSDSGQSAPASAGRPRHLRELRSWIGDVVSPHLEVDPDEGRGGVGDRADGLEKRLRALLRAPAIRSLESLWRSLLFLAVAAEGHPDVRFFVLDLSRDEAERMLAADTGSESALRRALGEIRGVPGSPPRFAAAVLGWEIGPAAADLLMLNRMAMLAHDLGVPVFAGAAQQLCMTGGRPSSNDAAGSDVFRDLWRELRATPGAASIVLVAPRFLLRAPYGEDSEPCEDIEFEEVEPGRESRSHRDLDGAYLWGNPAFVGAAALVQAFSEEGWDMDLSGARDFLPRPIDVAVDGSVLANPVRQVWSPGESMEMQVRGITPLIAFRDEARIRVPGVRSLSAFGAPVRGWWTR